MNFIKQYFIKRNINNNLKKATPLEAFSYNKVQKVAVLLDFSSVEEIDAFVKFKKELNISPENFISLGYKSQSEETSVNGLPVFSDKDISFSGVIHNYHADRLFEMEFDLLFNFFEGENLPLELLSSGIKARLRVGFPSTDQRYNDLIIHSDVHQQDFFLEQTKKVIQTIY